MRFSERYGHAQVRSVLQTNDIDQALRNRLWNVICSTFFEKVPKSQHNPSNFLSTQPFLGPLFLALWHDYFKTPIDAIGDSYIKSFGILREYFFKCPWHEVYDLIEFLTAHAGAHRQPGFVSSINKILKQELAGYRLVSGKIVQITAEEEIAAIEEALAVPDSLKPVREHLKQALALLADKKNPDYRNSIKESISAIESLSKIIAKLPKATLGPALAAIESKIVLHASLKEAFHKLYGYTSDAQGIRHALMDEPNLDIEDSKFMLVSCSAFVNYLVVKAHKAGISI